MPKLGCHSLFVDQTLVKKKKKDQWSNDNFQVVDVENADSGYLIIFPVSSLGYENKESVIANGLSGATVDILYQPVERKKNTPFYSADNVMLHHQMINIFTFYLCLGVPRMTPNNFVMLDPDARKTVICNSLLVKDDEDEKGTVAKKLNEDEKVAVANCIVVPFFELSAFSNMTFPDIFKRVQNKVLLRTLLLETGSYFMVRNFSLSL